MQSWHGSRSILHFAIHEIMENTLPLKTLRARLRNASAAELLYRIKRTVDERRISHQVCHKGRMPMVPDLVESAISGFNLPPLRVQAEPTLLKRIMRGYCLTLNFSIDKIVRFEKKWRNTCWNSVPMGEGGLDIRSVWEAGRLQHITAVCAAILQGLDAGLKKECTRWVRQETMKWLDKNPFLHGPHYRSAMECGLRIIAFIHVLKVIGKCFNAEERRQLAEAIYLHAWWVNRRLSLYSSLGNHTIAECVGLAAAGLLFKDTGSGKRWLSRSMKLLVQEASHQIRPDGGPAEQSINYHRFVLDLLWWVSSLYKHNGYKAQAASMLPILRIGEVFLQRFSRYFGEIPPIGDSDDGHAIAPWISPRREITSLEDKADRLLTFEYTGFSIVRLSRGGTLGFDHGDLGMPPLYNHGHADALSVLLNVAGKQVLTDPGTYGYNEVPRWRRYFKGTSAHNTVTIDDKDQAIQETGFIWKKPFRARLTHREISDTWWHLAATHDGYGRLSNPVIHLREIAGDWRGNIVIRDTFNGKGEHSYRLHYHLHPSLRVSSQGEWLVMEHEKIRLYMVILDCHGVEMIRGTEGTMSGWYSIAYGIKEPTTTIRCHAKGQPEDVTFVTIISISSRVPENNTLTRLLRILST